MNDDIISKADLWAYRIHAFQESGLSRKDWCQQNEIPQSTLGYWIRRLQSETPKTECTADPVFAKLPTEQELQFNSPAGTSPITILLPENIRIVNALLGCHNLALSCCHEIARISVMECSFCDGADSRPITKGISSCIHALPAL